jgi:hypothetical protein
MTREWFERGRAAGLLNEEDAGRLRAVESRTPEDLFADKQERPLVVALFGGTGVGKSSLLNRLAGSTIARTGVERPTSTELTLYLHRSIELADLPPELPTDSMRIQRHDDDRRRSVAWIDAPDIDSTHDRNRALVMAWLPHIDLLVYVVSPERYRDDAGWRVMLERRGKHGWLFVMNRWDEGGPEQRADLAAMLRRAGFANPLVLATCSAIGPAALPSPDELPTLEQAIAEVGEQHGVRELSRLGRRARLLELREAVRSAASRLGGEETWDAIREQAESSVRQITEEIVDGMQWPMRVAAGRIAAREVGGLGHLATGARLLAGRTVNVRVVGAARGEEAQPSAKNEIKRAGGGGLIDPSELDYLTRSTWDEWAQAKLEAGFDRIELAARKAGLVAPPLRDRLDEFGASAGQRVINKVQDSVRAALANPVTLPIRIARKITGFLTALLPTAALGLVLYTLVTSYFRAAEGSAEYPGTNFAVSSILLVLVAWALPFALDRSLRPSLEQALNRAIERAFADAADDLVAALTETIGRHAEQAVQLHGEGQALVREISAAVIRPGAAAPEAVDRLIANPERRAEPIAAAAAG